MGRTADMALVRSLAALSSAACYATEDRARRGLPPCTLVVADGLPPDAECPERLYIFQRWLDAALMLRPLEPHRSALLMLADQPGDADQQGAAGPPLRRIIHLGVLVHGDATESDEARV